MTDEETRAALDEARAIRLAKQAEKKERALLALKLGESVAEVARRYHVNPDRVRQWRADAQSR